MGRIRNSIDTVKASWRVLRQDKELLMFPVLSGISALALMALVVLPISATDLLPRVSQEDPEAQAIALALFVLLHLSLSFITVYFNAALVSAAMERLEGGDPTVSSGLRGANKRLGKIFAWAMFAGTVSLLIKALESATRRTNFIARIVVGFVGVAWTLATYFAIPIVLFEDRNVFASLRRSGELFRQRWGESVAGEFGIGAFFTILVLVVGLLAFFLAVFVSTAVGPVGLLIVLALAALALLTILVVGNALGTVYRAALYRFATKGQVPAEFQDEMIINAFRQHL